MTTVLVTGGAKGIGASIVERLSEAGYSLLIHYKESEQEAVQLSQRCKGSAIIQGDFSSFEGIEEFIKKVSHFNIGSLVNNVGNYLIKPLFETQCEDWNSLYFPNFLASVELVRSLQDSIRLNKGSIVNLGVAGLCNANSHSVAYHCLKSCLWTYTLALSKEMAASDVNVNMISPGHIENSVEQGSHVPMGRLGLKNEVAEAVYFCLSNKYITGQNIEVAGGVGL